MKTFKTYQVTINGFQTKEFNCPNDVKEYIDSNWENEEEITDEDVEIDLIIQEENIYYREEELLPIIKEITLEELLRIIKEEEY